jgi:hypothetical protein
LHNTEVRTQPWKTGLPADYHDYAPKGAVWLQASKRVARRIVSLGRDRYRPHPDPAQEQMFFALLKECLEHGGITVQFLNQAIRKKYLRKDTFALLARQDALTALAMGSA